jgi:hypothetical protein
LTSPPLALWLLGVLQLQPAQQRGPILLDLDGPLGLHSTCRVAGACTARDPQQQGAAYYANATLMKVSAGGLPESANKHVMPVFAAAMFPMSPSAGHGNDCCGGLLQAHLLSSLAAAMDLKGREAEEACRLRLGHTVRAVAKHLHGPFPTCCRPQWASPCHAHGLPLMSSSRGGLGTVPTGGCW